MSLTPSKRFKNWSGCSFTPTINGVPGTPVPIPGIQSCKFDRGCKKVTASGDGDIFLSTIATDVSEPSFTITTNKPGPIDLIPDDAEGIFTITRNDARNGSLAGGGGIIYTMNVAAFDPTSQDGSHRQFGSGSAKFSGYSVDGVTNPVSTSPA